jgi:hypothetical protein
MIISLVVAASTNNAIGKNNPTAMAFTQRHEVF